MTRRRDVVSDPAMYGLPRWYRFIPLPVLMVWVMLELILDPPPDSMV